VIRAHAPGKLVALGEYAVLDGAPAVVLAVDRRVAVALGPSPDGACRLETRAPDPVATRFPAGTTSGAGLVDLVTALAEPPLAWHGAIDSSALFANGAKLGLGSSAAVLTAFAGAFAAYARAAGRSYPEPTLARLIDLHRAFQGGRGSGLDVAASFTGGAIVFSLSPGGMPQVGSVRLPNSVGFAGVFPGHSASTPELVAHYRAWRAEQPRRAEALMGRLGALAEAGCAAASGNDAAAWLAAFAAYGRGLADLGDEIGVPIVTAEHRQIGQEAERFGVAYKVSGAGGGDLGLACAADAAALAAFTQSIEGRGFRVINVTLAERGLVVEPPDAGVKS
jgi:phosphomevalonate kinase